ncbi:zinc finger and BTB domain-containing protein 5 [Grus japonensis]|uniref:Zinc finger and BTB domain-containing protein 5 n=1 Tax=Grus japonensis TaxID=30415 RepID=A0ABC9WT21_GRUJA
MVRQAVLLQPMEVNGGADIHLQPMEHTVPEQMDGGPAADQTPGRNCSPMDKSPHWSRSSGRTCGPTGDPLRNSPFLKNCTPWKGPTPEKFVKNCSAWEGLILEKFVKDCLA